MVDSRRRRCARAGRERPAPEARMSINVLHRVTGSRKPPGGRAGRAELPGSQAGRLGRHSGAGVRHRAVPADWTIVPRPYRRGKQR
ncbi:unnamed protein product [[Actinomadura] parvosata subsp. kistnae]|nr:unnamed protein product [Actinomadura parvosata subsp. kistnae]